MTVISRESLKPRMMAIQANSLPDLCCLLREWSDRRAELDASNPGDWTVQQLDRRIDEGLSILSESICDRTTSDRPVDEGMDQAIRKLAVETLRRIGLTWNPCLDQKVKS